MWHVFTHLGFECENADCKVLLGDFNWQHTDPDVCSVRENCAWQDAFFEAGSPAQYANTWHGPHAKQPWTKCPGQYRYDRICYIRETTKAGDTDTCELMQDSFCAGEHSSDHRSLSAQFILRVHDQQNPCEVHQDLQRLYRPGIGKNVGRQPSHHESCAKEQGIS